MTSALKNPFSLKPPKIRRQHLRRYSWLPDVFRLKGSIISRIVGPVLTVTLFATIVAYANSKGYSLVLTNSVVPLLSVVVGLILVFRNSTSYDRYWEGRKAFTVMISNIRNLCRQVWVNVATLPPEQEATIKGKMLSTPLTPAQLRQRKIETLQLCLSYSYSVKHYLRGEDGVHWEDYNGILPPVFSKLDDTSKPDTMYASMYSAATLSGSVTPSIGVSGRTTPDGIPNLMRGDATKRVRRKRSKRELPGASSPLLGHRTVDFQPLTDESMPLPLIIAHELTRRIFQFRRDGLLETVGPAGTNAMSQLIQSMVDQMSVMERVANTPIPVSYAIHLKQCVTLYLFSLPLTLVTDLGWLMIPIVTVVAFTFMGIEGIADEIEMPFGTDDADLPLDRYCHDLKEEVNYMIHRLPEMGEGVYGYDDGEGDD